MKERYTTIVLGGGYYALGYASTHPDCLILEESQSLGGDFHHCLHPVRMENCPDTARNSGLGQIMTEFGVWTESGFDLLKAQTVVHEYASRMLETGLEILLDAHFLSAERADSGVKVTFFTNEGIQEVWADKLVDTTADCVSDPKAVRCTAKTLNAFTVAMTENFAQTLQKACPECCVLAGPMENEKLILFPVPPQMGLTDAYFQMMAAWSRAFPAGEEKILFVAETFDARYEAAERIPEGWVAARFADPVSAFVEGAVAK